MTSVARSSTSSPRPSNGWARPDPGPPVVFAFVSGLASVAALALSASFVDILDGTLDQHGFLIAGVVGVPTFVWLVRHDADAQPTVSHAMTAIMTHLLTLIGATGLLYWAMGLVDHLDDGLFEAAAGYSTTSWTLFADEWLTTVDRSVIWFRAGTQWVGALAGLVIGFVILPWWARRSARRDGDGFSRIEARALSAPRLFVGVLLPFLGFTTATSIVLFATGTDWFSALSMGVGVTSTGGFVGASDAITQQSPLVTWILTVVMVIGGMSFALGVKAIRGNLAPMRQSVELRVYLGAFVATAALLTFDHWNEVDSGRTAFREATFTAASLVSTTGFHLVDWSRWSDGSETLILLVIGVGSMGGAIGGGFRWYRAIEMVQFCRQTLLSQIHPHAIIPVRVGTRVVSEGAVRRLTAHEMALTVTAAVGAVGLATSGIDVRSAVSGAISALSTMGPGLGELSGETPIGEVLDRPGRAVLAVLMLLGRVTVYPAAIFVAVVYQGVRRRFGFRH